MITIDDLNTEFTVWSSEINIGTANTGSYNVSYRASHDTTLNSNDPLIGTVHVDNLAPFSVHESEWSGTFPYMDPGEYWIFWMIDSDNDVDELIDDGENDNIGLVSSYRLVVEEIPHPYMEWIRLWVDGIGVIPEGFPVARGNTLQIQARYYDAFIVTCSSSG